jgi:tRNA1(Val) A37 N6-methylase TrmN6
MKTELEKDEVLEDLQCNGLSIVQSKKEYKFSMDSVLLANFVRVKKTDFVVELCSGCGVVSILVDEKCKPKRIVGIEQNSALFVLSQKSIFVNHQTNIEFVCDDLKNAPKIVGNEAADAVICNPPYFEKPQNSQNINPKYLATKYETTASLADILLVASRLVKFGGKVFFVYSTLRLPELLSIATKNNLACKQLKFVFNGDKSDLVLVKFVKGAKGNCIVEKY